MPRPLIIVESPAKARTIEKFLGRRYAVKASMGHVRDLPRSQFGVDTERRFEPKYITIRGKGSILKELREAARKSSRVYLATDPDREGEAISWHLAELLDLPNRDSCRVEFHEITKEAVDGALQHPRGINTHLVDAQQARRVLDRVVGYKLSPLLWAKVRRGLSAGRVQSVAVRLIVDREAEISSFVPREYWTLQARLTPLDRDTPFVARYHAGDGKRRELAARSEVDQVLEELAGAAFQVKSVVKKERLRQPPLPFTTSTLQQEAARKLGFTARRTMSVVQQLYEGLDVPGEGRVGLVTYIRTDSTRVSEASRAEAHAYVAGRFGEEYGHPPRRGGDRRPGVQGAHEAIRPTAVRRDPDSLRASLGRDQLRLYRLIWERFVASQMSPARLEAVAADVTAGRHLFRATGSTMVFPGFTLLYVEGRDEDAEEEPGLPPLAEGEDLRLLGLDPAQHFTQPPPRYTEAMLVKALEENGIGRPSTYAPIIETIQQRGYVEKEARRFVPSQLGQVVVALLKEHFPQVIDVEFTAGMEGELDRVEEGAADWRQVVQEFYDPFAADLERAQATVQRVELPEEKSGVICEKCGREMVVKHGRYGKFLACPGFPECRNTKPFLEPLGVHCPLCGGEMAQKKSKKGRRFYGCTNYPACNFVTWHKPTRRTCPRCGAFLVEKGGRGKKTYLCARPGCGWSSAEEATEQVAEP
jgi:DNA topoisomerase-1